MIYVSKCITMVKVRIQKIIWDKYNTEHIKKHGVTVEEVEKVIASDVNISEGHSGKKILVSRIELRLLAVIGSMKGNKIYIVTARDASKEERQKFYEYEQNKTN